MRLPTLVPKYFLLIYHNIEVKSFDYKPKSVLASSVPRLFGHYIFTLLFKVRTSMQYSRIFDTKEQAEKSQLDIQVQVPLGAQVD